MKKTFLKSKTSYLGFDHNQSLNYQKTLLFSKNIEEKKILGGFVGIFEPANSGFHCRPVLILQGLKFRTLKWKSWIQNLVQEIFPSRSFRKIFFGSKEKTENTEIL